MRHRFPGCLLVLLAAASCGDDSAATPDAGVDSSIAPAPDASADASSPQGDASSGADAASTDATTDSHAASTDATTDSPAASTDATTDSPADAPPEAAPPYNPCPPAGTPCRIMPLGDSITYGFSSSTGGGYRVPLFQKALDAHQTITFVGSQTTGPAMVGGVAFPTANEGHSGYTIDTGGGRQGIQPLVQSALQTYKPHIVTLMIGTNDVDIQLDLANAAARLGKLMDTILAADPSLLLVVAQITPTQDDGENALDVAYNAAIPGLVSARAQQGKHVLLVDMYGAFTAHAAYKTDYLANKLHPNDAGFVVMGGVWYAALGSLFR
jgi:lysophospholipase L1-like esterase